MKSGKFTKLQRKLMGGAPKPAKEPFRFGGANLAATDLTAAPTVDDEEDEAGGGSNPASEGGKGFKTNTRSLTRDRAGYRQGQADAAAEKRKDAAVARRKEQRAQAQSKRRKRYTTGSNENINVQAGD
jgi:hypothetical protein